ncbi:hypothetical protein Hokovirus_2_97 [Hokovirus HKV1]|uniref:Uncharacterized protein n=1 Tax=Hokovirus HKV1 TaxID=1977638 RepID=A0A1V0SFS7_9VIRU|nr:hypothetical protein Hokovirus_2_97 [Hokovirus HKV1]
MDKYHCNYCNFYAPTLSKFQRHNKTLKHLQNINNAEQKKDNTNNKKIKVLSRTNNNKKYLELEEKLKLTEEKLRNAKKKNKILQVKLNKISEEKNKILEDKMKFLEGMIQNKDEKLQNKDDTYNSLVNQAMQLKNNGKYKQINVTILNCASNEVNPLDNIDFNDILEKYIINTNKINLDKLPKKICALKNCDGNCNKKYICPSKHIIPKKMMSLWNQTNNSNLCSDYITNAIVNYYKETDNAKLLPIINTDTSRNTYFLKIKNGIENEWINDKKGLKFTSIVIEPFINYIISLLSDFDNELTKNILNNKVILSLNAYTYFEDQLKELEKYKPTKESKLNEYEEQRKIYLEYLNIFKNYKDSALMKDISDILDICIEHCIHIYDQYIKKNLQINNEKVLISHIINCFNKATFINTILTNISPHFHKTHENILDIIK